MKIWVTKRLFTEGILECETLEEHNASPSMVCVAAAQDALFAYVCFHKPDWHTTQKEAEARAAKMIAARRATIAKQLKRIDAIDLAPKIWPWAT